MEFILVVLAILVVTGLVAAVIASRPRGKGGTDLEPPPSPPLSRPGRPSGRRERGRSVPSAEELDRQAAEVVAEAEALLAGA
ncbi:MAG TPA: hypothetical protein VM390_04390, partial [Acidimicrobiales bacterium]|nr:hypothetical protein [Acidimicrobiales bacterium]